MDIKIIFCFSSLTLFAGDGTFSELFNGLIYRKMISEHSGNDNNQQPNFENILSPDIPCGKMNLV